MTPSGPPGGAADPVDPSRARGADVPLGIFAAAILMAMVLVTVVDVVGRYLLSRPLPGGFEITELLLLVLIFAGLPLASSADQHVTMDFIDYALGERGRSLVARGAHAACAAVLGFLACLAWRKAERIASYRDASDILGIPYGPFVHFMAIMLLVAGLIHLRKAFGSR